MQESFDKKISQKIRDTFEHYYEPINPEAWENMKMKLLRKKRKKIIILNNIAKVASVIIIMGISILLPVKINTYNNHSEITRWEQKIKKTENNNIINTKNKIVINTENNKVKSINKNRKIKNDLSENNSIKTIIVKNKNLLEKIKFKDILLENNSIKTELAINRNLSKNMKKDKSKQLLSTTNTKTKAQDKPILITEITDFNETKNKDKINIAVSLSSYYNYADIQVSSNVNFGGGFLTEFVVNKNISINSGVMFSKHDISYIKQNENNRQPMDFINQKKENKNTEVNLLGFDIPLNIRINVKNFFISAGVSSLVYIKEEYIDNYSISKKGKVFNYETGKWEENNIIENISENENIKAFETFDFAKLMNFSIGYEIPIKYGNIIVEPYLKYPVKGLTNRNIEFGFGGVALMYYF